MAKRPASFTQADIRRALLAAKSAGLDVTGCRIAPGGEIHLQFAGNRPGLSALEGWKAGKHDAR